MAFNNSFTAVVGATYTASQYNTHVRDNFTAIWVYTTAGDIAYASSATALARLGIGAAGGLLYSTGSAPAWTGAGTGYQILGVSSGIPTWTQRNHFAIVYKTSTQSFSSGAALADITWNAEVVDQQGWHDNSTNPARITIIDTGYYIPFVKLHWTKDAGGDGTIFHIDAVVQLNGVDTANAVHSPQTKDAINKKITFGGIAVNATAGQYFTVQMTQDSGGTGALYGGTAIQSTFFLLRCG